MQCTRCRGLVVLRFGEHACLNCGHRPDERRIEPHEKCLAVECRKRPTINGYCENCWQSRKRSELTDQERSARYRARMREKQRARRADAKEQVNAARILNPADELSRPERDH